MHFYDSDEILYPLLPVRMWAAQYNLSILQNVCVYVNPYRYVNDFVFTAVSKINLTMNILEEKNSTKHCIAQLEEY